MIKLIDYILVLIIIFISIFVAFLPKLIRCLKSKFRKKSANTTRAQSVQKQPSNDDEDSASVDGAQNFYDRKFAKFYIETINSFSELEQLNEEYLQTNENKTRKIWAQKNTINEFKNDGSKNQEPNFLLNSVSLVISFTTSISIIALPVEFYFHGFRSLQFSFNLILGSFIVAYFFVPFFHQLKSKSLYEYLDDKFDSRKRVKIFALFLIICFQLIYAALILYTISLCLKQILVADFASMQLWMISLCLGLLSAFLAILGLKSLIWLNFAQYLISVSCICLISFLGVKNFDPDAKFYSNYQKIWRTLNENNRQTLFKFEENFMYRYTFWNTFFGLAISAVSALGLTQQSYMRIKTTKSVREAQTLILCTIPFGFVQYLFITLLGSICFIYITKCGDPFSNGLLENQNALVTKVLSEYFTDYHGIFGLFIGILISSSLGSLSNAIKALSVIFIEDVLNKTLLKSKDELFNLNRENSLLKRQQIESEKQIELLYGDDLISINNKNSTKTNLRILNDFKKDKLGVYRRERHLATFIMLSSSILIIFLSVLLEFLPGSLYSIVLSLQNCLHGPIVFIFVCARFNEFSLKRFKLSANVGRMSKLKNFQLKSNDVILSSLASISLLLFVYIGRLLTMKHLYEFYNKETLEIVQQDSLNFNSTLCSLEIQNSAASLEKKTSTNSNDITLLNYLFGVSFNWYSFLGFLTCLFALFLLNITRLVLDFLVSSVKKINCCSACTYKPFFKPSSSNKPKLVISVND